MDRTQLYMTGGFVACSAAVVYLVTQIFQSGGELRRHQPSEFVPPGFAELETVVQEVRRNWLPREKERALERVRLRAESLEAAMTWVLTRPRHPLFPPTVDLTVALPLTRARPLIAAVAMTGPMAQRPSALLAAERLSPWSSDELSDFLLEGAVPVKIAALELCAAREDPPVAAVLELLAHPQEPVREAALNAMPARMAPGIVRSLMDLADSGEPGSDAAVRALARTELTEEIETALVERLPDGSPAVQTAILDALTEQDSPLHDPLLLWDLALSDAPVEVRAKALHCLESKNAFDLELVRMELPAMPPKLRYFAARCMLRSGDLEAIETLLDLAASDNGSRETRVAARQLLETITGRPLHHGVEAWRAWYREQSSLPAEARALPAPPF